MQSSPPGGGPRILRCPNCGAPIDAPAFAHSARCSYCQQTVMLAEPSAPKPLPAPVRQTPAPYAPALHKPAASGGSGRWLFLAVFAGVALTAAFVAFSWAQTVPLAAAPTAPQAHAAVVAAPLPKPQAVAKSAPPNYPLGSLLRINATTVDIDGSQSHMVALFPTVTSARRADKLLFTLPLNDPWFNEAELSWMNEKGGMLTSVALRPVGEGRFKNQKEIADCLAKSLGQPKVQEIDHLSGDTSYFFGQHWPKASVDVYSSYLWLAFDYSRGIGPVTFANVIKTLNGCTRHAP